MLATILLFVLLFICLFIFVFCKGCLCNHLSGVIIFLRTRKLFLAGGFYSLIVGKVAIVRFFRQSDAILGQNGRYYEADY